MLYQLHTTCLWPDFQIRKWRWCWCSYRWQGCHIGDRISSLFFGIWKREINTVTWIIKKRKVSAYVVLQKLAFPSLWLCCKFTCATTKFVQIVQNIHSSALLIQFHARSFQILVTNQHQTHISLVSYLDFSLINTLTINRRLMDSFKSEIYCVVLQISNKRMALMGAPPVPFVGNPNSHKMHLQGIMVYKLHRSVPLSWAAPKVHGFYPGLRSILHLIFMEIRWVDFVQSCWWTNQQTWVKTWPPWQRSNT